jgi:hypothetical protein
VGSSPASLKKFYSAVYVTFTPKVAMFPLKAGLETFSLKRQKGGPEAKINFPKPFPYTGDLNSVDALDITNTIIIPL